MGRLDDFRPVTNVLVARVFLHKELTGDLSSALSVHDRVQALETKDWQNWLVGGLGCWLFACSAAPAPPATTEPETGPSVVPSSRVAKPQVPPHDGETNEKSSPPDGLDETAEERARTSDPTAPGPNLARRDCGPAKPNPHGFTSGAPPYPVPAIDGTCAVCERAPEALPGCAPKEVGQRLTERLAERKGARVTVAATLAMKGTMCMGVGSICRCASKCSSPLSLIPRGHTYQSYAEAPLPPPRLALAWPQQANPEQRAFFERWAQHFDLDLIMHCTGDEASLCCPIDFNRSKQLEDVVVTGTISEYEDVNGWTYPTIEVERICRPQVTTGKSWQRPSDYVPPPPPPCTGTLSFETNIEVKLAVDHISRGKSPLRPLEVEAGSHEILFLHHEWGVLAPGTKVEVGCGQKVHKKFDLKPPAYLKRGREEQQAREAAFEAELDALPCTGKLHLTSKPTTLAVVNNRPRGRTPQKSLRVPPGKHTVLFNHPNFENEVTKVTVGCGQTRFIHMKMKKRRR